MVVHSELDLKQSLVAGCCEVGNEITGATKWRQFI
jgi:hypothetical protein